MNIVWRRPDGGISVTHLTKEAVSPEHEAEKLKARGDIPSNYDLVGYRQVIPGDRSFRDAWIHKDGKFDHDISKCKDILRQKFRGDRMPLLASLDIEYQRADEDGDSQKKKEIAAKKKALRDLPSHPSIEAAQTVEELKALTIEKLSEVS